MEPVDLVGKTVKKFIEGPDIFVFNDGSSLCSDSIGQLCVNSPEETREYLKYLEVDDENA